MFSINSGETNNNCTIIILICVVIFYLFFINLNTSPCSDKSIDSVHNSHNLHNLQKIHNLHNLQKIHNLQNLQNLQKIQKDKEYIKDILTKQEKILLNLQNKIEKKIADKNAKSNSKNTQKYISKYIPKYIPKLLSKEKLNTIETLDGSIELTKSFVNKYTKLAKIKPTQNNQDQYQYQDQYQDQDQDQDQYQNQDQYQAYSRQPHSRQSHPQHPQHPQHPHHPTNPHNNPYPPMIPPVHRQTDPMYIRDNQVLNDRLYPPLGRTERPTADLLMNFINNQPDLFNMNTRGPPDTFRPIGYLTRKDGDQTMDSTLILFGRAKYPNSDLGEFYVTSSNKMSDIKVPILQNNSNIKKITDVPNDVDITGNLFNGKYAFTELPKPDFPTPYM